LAKFWILLVLAVASPFTEVVDQISGDPRVKLLIDNSTSMDLFDLSVVDNLKVELEKKLPVEEHYIASGMVSGLGDGILSNIGPNEVALLVSDGNSNDGPGLGDVILQSNEVNASLSALKIEPNRFDASVNILGPDKTTAKSLLKLSGTLNGSNAYRMACSGPKATAISVKVRT